MADKFEGEWKLEETKNFDDYLKAVGVGMVMRKMAAQAKPKQIIGRKGTTWTIKTESKFKDTTVTFVENEEFDETTGDGRKVKSTAHLEGSKMIIVQKGTVDSTFTRELTGDDTFTMTLEAKGVTCTRMYKRTA